MLVDDLVGRSSDRPGKIGRSLLVVGEPPASEQCSAEVRHGRLTGRRHGREPETEVSIVHPKPSASRVYRFPQSAAMSSVPPLQVTSPRAGLDQTHSKPSRIGREGPSNSVGFKPYQQYGDGASPNSEKGSLSKAVPFVALSVERTN